MIFKSFIRMPLVVLALLEAGCDRDIQPAPVSTTNAQSPNAALNSMAEARDEFLSAARQKMQDLDARIKELSDNSASYKEDAKVNADNVLADLRTRRTALGKDYDDLKQSSQETWDKTKAAFSAGWEDMQKAFRDARAKFDKTP